MTTPYQYYLHGLPMTVLLLSGLVVVLGVVLLRSAWRATSFKVRYWLDTNEVTRLRTQTQRKRYVKLVAVAVLGLGMTFMQIAVDEWVRPYDLYYGMSAVREQNVPLAIFLSACQMLPLLLVGVAALVLVRVKSHRATFAKKIMFGPSKGQYIFGMTIPDSKTSDWKYYDMAPTDFVDRI